MDAITAFWATVLGAAIGVVAGSLIQYLVDYFVKRRDERTQRQSLKKEMQYNLLIVSNLINEARNLRNSFNADSLPSYFGYMEYDRGNFTQASALLSNGQLYSWFSIEDLKKIIEVSRCLNVNNANWVNNNIKQRREAAEKGEGYDKREVGNFIKFIEDQIIQVQGLLNYFVAVL